MQGKAGRDQRSQGRAFSVAAPRDGTSGAPTRRPATLTRALSVPDAAATTSAPAEAECGAEVPGSKRLSHPGQPALLLADGSTAGSPSVVVPAATEQASEEFDIFRFLNDGSDSTKLLRDPVLQQMCVARYEGDVDATTGFFHGQGRLVSTLGYTYTGAFDRGLMHGKGRIEWSDGTAFEGAFAHNVLSGEGKYSWPNGDWYEGTVEDCARHGKGTFFYKSLNETYEGWWHRGTRHGKGTLKYTPDGSVCYRGEWARDRRNGHGTMVYASGVYDGEWKNDVRHGKGKMVWKKDGVVVEEYVGEWVAGAPCGQGQSTYIRPAAEFHATPPLPSSTLQVAPPTMTPSAESHLLKKDAAVNTYTGEFLNGMRHGFGTFIFDDGGKYEGQWVENQKHGEGKFTSGTGVVYCGAFSEGNPVTPVNDQKPADMTVSSPLPLFIRDLLGEAENNVQEAVTAVQSVISRNSGLFKKLFAFYCGCETAVEMFTTPHNWKATRTQGNMSLIQFFRLLNEAKLLNRHTTPAAVGRLLLAFKDRNTTTSPTTYLTGEDATPAAGHAGKSPTSPVSAELRHLQPPEAPTTGPVTPREAGLHGGGTKEASGGSSPPSTTQNEVRTARSERNSISSLRSSRGGRHASASAVKEPYSAPWARYRTELHLFCGELGFREFVEALVRVADHHYDTARFGNLAQKLTLVIEEHLAPFTCSRQNSDPLCPLSRENRQVLQPHAGLLERYFLAFACGNAFEPVARSANISGGSGGKDGGNSPVAGVTMTVRQLSLMLKDLGVVDGERFSLTAIPKIAPFERHPQLATHVGKRALQTTAPLAPPASATAGDRAAGSERGSTMSLEAEPRFVEGGEAVYRSRCLASKRSKGIANANVHATLVMEQELTFAEFVDAVARVAVIRCNDNTQAQRIGTFLQRFFVANEGKKL